MNEKIEGLPVAGYRAQGADKVAKAVVGILDRLAQFPGGGAR